MTTAQAAQLSQTEVVARPRYEGSNICTWIGFKHVMYLVEEAVLDHLRQGGLVPRELYEEYGLGVEIADSDARILSALHMDDLVRTVVTRVFTDDPEMAFRTESFVRRQDDADDDWTKAVTAKVRVILRRDADGGSVPVELQPYTVARLDRAAPAGAVDTSVLITGPGASEAADEPLRTLVGDANGVVWRRRIPYFYCHFSKRLQHSGYLRVMEEVVDLFLAERGISIRTMLDSRAWIPVVPRARVNILAEAYMEEELYTVFSVMEVFKDLTYTATMDCYVRRADQYVRTATGTITHGYAVVLDRRDWSLVPFDEQTITALRGRRTRDHKGRPT